MTCTFLFFSLTYFELLHQVAIVFKTPAYWNVAIERPIKVQLELRRKSDQETSDPVEFTYQPQMFGMSVKLFLRRSRLYLRRYPL